MEPETNESSTPDLQSILATLAQHTSNGGNAASAIPQHAGSPTPPIPESEMREPPARDSLDTAQDPRLSARVTPQPSATSAPQKPMIDPSTITAWQDALRCVTKIAAQNAQFAVSIKKMMKEQRANEMRWYTERQNLKQTQANRSSSAAKAQSILKTLNTSFSGSPPTVEVDAEAELAAFDRKIYAAQQDMETAMSAQLKSLGVPFFGTDHKLVVSNEKDPSKEALPEGHPKWSPLVTESQLLGLRRKMVQHLEDLYRE